MVPSKERIAEDPALLAQYGDRLEYTHQVVEYQVDEVGLEVGLTQKFEHRGDAVYYLIQYRERCPRYTQPGSRLRLRINTEIKED